MIGELKNRIIKERNHGKKIRPILVGKGWRYSVPNNNFEKGTIIAYFYEDELIFHFSTSVNNRAYHKIKLTTNTPVNKRLAGN